MVTPTWGVTATNRSHTTIPDYVISQTIAAEHQYRRLRNTPDPDVPEPRPRHPEATDRLTMIRRQLGTVLHTVARRIDPAPAGRR